MCLFFFFLLGQGSRFLSSLVLHPLPPIIAEETGAGEVSCLGSDPARGGARPRASWLCPAHSPNPILSGASHLAQALVLQGRMLTRSSAHL